MHDLRAFLRSHLHLALTLVLLACAMKAFVPTGFMLGAEDTGGARVLTIRICADTIGTQPLRRIVIPGHPAPASGHAEAPCHFTALGHGLVAAADPVLLALALGFIIAVGLASLIPVRPATPQQLRPPLRGPPLGR